MAREVPRRIEATSVVRDLKADRVVMMGHPDLYPPCGKNRDTHHRRVPVPDSLS